MTVSFHSPLPPARTGVADYAASLLPCLRRHGTVELEGRRGVPLYHLGNNALHGAIYHRALARPGVVVLHDAVLHHFLLGQLDQPRYLEEFVYNYGEWNRQLAADLWRGRAASAAESRYFAWPMLRRIVESARAVVVHNPAAARLVREHVPGARIEEIPHLFAPPELPGEAAIVRHRQRLGIGPELFLFGVFGYLRESKRLPDVLAAFREARRECPRMALQIAGQFVSTDLERAVAPLLAAPGIWRLPHLPEREFWMAAAAVDACINLRHPAAGETSGIAIRLMGIGKPVMVSDGEECAGFPEGACIRISPGAGERAALRAHMILVTSMQEVARSVARCGAEHIRECHRVDEVSDRYWKLLCDVGT